MSDNVHEGHRARLKTKYLEHGLDGFTDIEALELLLFYALPRRNTNELAHGLLDRFRSFRGVLEADVTQLQEVPGVGENAATLLALVSSLNRRYQQSASARGARINSSGEAGAFLQPYFAYRTEECCVLLCMDTAGHVIDCHRLAEGSPGSVDLPVRELVELALRDKAARVILAHNHLSGVALPSNADVSATGEMLRLLRAIHVDLVDHIIVSEGDFVSMRDSGYFKLF